MSMFANLKLRRKLLIAMAPLAIMAILAAAYSSIEISTLDDWYSQPAAIMNSHGANRWKEGKSGPRSRTGQPSWQLVSRFRQ